MIRNTRLFSSFSAALFATFFVAAVAAQKPADTTKAAVKAAPAKASACKLDDKGTTPMKVKLTTSMGAITLELNKEKAPLSTENFVKYVESGHYSGTIFHRVIGNFMIQGGGFDKNLAQKPTNPPIKNEAANGLKNDNYTVAMARTGVVDSATAQFFINLKHNAMLDQPTSRDGSGYTVFGMVVDGMDVVDKIRVVPTRAQGPHQNVPVMPVTIRKATVEK